MCRWQILNLLVEMRYEQKAKFFTCYKLYFQQWAYIKLEKGKRMRKLQSPAV